MDPQTAADCPVPGVPAGHWALVGAAWRARRRLKRGEALQAVKKKR